VIFVVFLLPRWLHGLLLDLAAGVFVGGIVVLLAALGAVSTVAPIVISSLLIGCLGVACYWLFHSSRRAKPYSIADKDSAEAEVAKDLAEQESGNGALELWKSKPETLSQRIEVECEREFTIYKDEEKTVTLKAFLQRRSQVYDTMIYALLHPYVMTEEEKQQEADRNWASLAVKLREAVSASLSQHSDALEREVAPRPRQEEKDGGSAFSEGDFKQKELKKSQKPRRGWISRVLLKQLEEKKRERQVLAQQKEEMENEFSFDFSEDVLPSPLHHHLPHHPHPLSLDAEEPAQIERASAEDAAASPHSLSASKTALLPQRGSVRPLVPRHMRLQREMLYRKIQEKEGKEKDEEFSINLFEADESDEAMEDAKEAADPSLRISVTTISADVRKLDEHKAAMKEEEQYVELLSKKLQKLKNLKVPKSSRLEKEVDRAVRGVQEEQSALKKKTMDEEGFSFADLVVDDQLPSLALSPTPAHPSSAPKSKSSTIRSAPPPQGPKAPLKTAPPPPSQGSLKPEPATRPVVQEITPQTPQEARKLWERRQKHLRKRAAAASPQTSQDQELIIAARAEEASFFDDFIEE
jgi:superoxide dismutase